jgi:hypothetical protein
MNCVDALEGSRSWDLKRSFCFTGNSALSRQCSREDFCNFLLRGDLVVTSDGSVGEKGDTRRAVCQWPCTSSLVGLHYEVQHPWVAHCLQSLFPVDDLPGHGHHHMILKILTDVGIINECLDSVLLKV